MVRGRQGALLPHAPLLLPQVGASLQEPSLERVRVATRAAARGFDREVVVLSPHGPATGVYLHTRASLDGFGIPRASARVRAHVDAARELAAAWGKPVLDEPIDHGVVVPLLLGPLPQPVIAVAFAEDDDPTGDAEVLAQVLLASDHDVVASVNTGAGITRRAPLTQLDGGAGLEADLRRVLEDDVAGAGPVARRLSEQGGSCCLAPVLVVASVFAGCGAEVLAHEWPFGVGYLVARFGMPA